MYKLTFSTFFLFSITLQVQAKAGDHCYNQGTTLETNTCLSKILVIAAEQQKIYLVRAYQHNSYYYKLIKAMKKEQKDWQQYKKSSCNTTYIAYREGSIRNTKYLLCEIQLTHRRTHDIWQNYLTYADSTPPVLAEPSY